MIRRFTALMVFVFLMAVFSANRASAYYDGWMDFETTLNSSYPPFPCFSGDHFLYDVSELNNASMTISYNPSGDITKSGSNDYYKAVAARAAIYFASMAMSGGTLTAVIALVDMAIMQTVCRSMFVFKPHEYVAFQNKGNWGINCNEPNGGRGMTMSSGAGKPPVPTQDDVPYYYHCDPTYDPVNDCYISTTSSNDRCRDRGRIGYTYGYGGLINKCRDAITPYYAVSTAGSTLGTLDKSMLGRIAVGFYPEPELFIRKMMNGALIYSSYSKCDTGSIDTTVMGIDSSMNWLGAAGIVTFMRYDIDTSQVKMCAASITTLLPVVIGCAPVAMPAEVPNSDPYLQSLVRDSRCEYVSSARTDLHYLPILMKTQGQEIGSALKKFLLSDFHPISNVVGCLQDMLTKVFVSDPSDPTNPHNYKSFFAEVQSRFRAIVFAALTLYVCMVGIKIMLSQGQMQKGDYIMLLLKFGLVYYFAIGNAWQTVYPAVLNAPNEIASIFVDSWGSMDPRKHCQYDMPDGKNLLGEHMFNVGNANVSPPVNTLGFENTIKITVWDLLDCKVVNYLNLGSCNYSLTGILVVFILGGFLLFSGAGFLIGILAFIYAFLTLKMALKFVHIFILSAFTVALLVFTSPIFLCFALFEKTKGIFNEWAKTLIGYIIYPALPFAFLALIFTTMDLIYYGNIDTSQVTNCTGPVSECSLYVPCTQVDSIFCKIVILHEPATSTLCTQSDTFYTNNFIDKNTFSVLGDKFKYYGVRSDAIASIFMAMAKMMFLSFFFLSLSESITRFLAQLVGVQSFGGHAKGDGTDIFGLLTTPISVIKKSVQ